MHRKTILLVEDDKALSTVTAESLEKEGFNVLTAYNGLEALELIQTNVTDLCVVDTMMPVLDGYSFVSRLRKKDTEKPVIFLSARNLKEDISAAFESGGNDYMRKPFTIEELILRIKELMRRSGLQSVSDKRIIGSYTLDKLSRNLIHSEGAIKLTYREAEIISLLNNNRNMIVTTDQLLHDIWGDKNNHKVRSLNVFVTRIRKYFRYDPQIQIVNVRATGYKMIYVSNYAE